VAVPAAPEYSSARLAMYHRRKNMKSLAFTLAAALMVSLTQYGCAADPAKPSVAAQGGRFSILLGPPQTCSTIQNPCPIPVTIQTISGTSGQTLCQASLTSSVTFPGTTSTAQNRRIVWTLLPPSSSPANLSWAFETKNGILVTADSANQLFGRGLGDGAGNNSALMFHAFNQQNLVNSQVTYLPIVLQTDSSTSPATVSLCAVADPKIINSN
jgi:hypothetical protein